MRRQTRTRRRLPPIKHTLRLYPGVDDDLIEGLDQLAAQLAKPKNQIIKDALRERIGDGSVQPAVSVEPAVNLAEIRQVVEAAVSSSLARFEGQMTGVAVTVEGQEDDETRTLLGNLGAALIFDDDEPE
ncbi:MAG: ribbon-helix-helix protein, CopG family [Anaerolineae bacterium]